MYDEFRLTILREMSMEGLDEGAMRCVMGIVDRLGGEYDVSRKETALVPADMTSPRLLMEYLACKSLEGLSRETLRVYRATLARFLLDIGKMVCEIDSNDIRCYLYNRYGGRAARSREIRRLKRKTKTFPCRAHSAAISIIK